MVVNDLESSRVDDVVASITADGGTAVGGPADVSDSAQVKTLSEAKPVLDQAPGLGAGSGPSVF